MNDALPANNKPSGFALLKAKLGYARCHSFVPLLIAVVCSLWFLIDWGHGWKLADKLKTHWNEELDQVVSFATLLVALSVWYGEMAETWQRSLGKRLTVRFVDNQGKLVLLCHNAHLSHEADIRNLGQQIGSQMCKGAADNQPDTKLKFSPANIVQHHGEILHDPKIGYYLHYQATFVFTELSENLTGKGKITLDRSKGQFLLWQTPFADADILLMEPGAEKTGLPFAHRVLAPVPEESAASEHDNTR